MTNHDAARWGVSTPPGHKAGTETAPAERRPSDQRREPLAGSMPIMPAPSDLRQRFADAIRDAAEKHLPICDEDGCECDIGVVSSIYGDGQTMAVEGSVTGLAEVCAGVVQAEFDDLAMTAKLIYGLYRSAERDATEARDETARYRTYARDWEREALAERQRAEVAEAEIVQLRRNISAAHRHLNEIATERDAATERAEAAEEQLAEIREEGLDW